MLKRQSERVKLRVAAVQVPSDNGQSEKNLARAEARVAEAAALGGKLVLCPEFLAAGYVYEESIWDSAEPRGGLTETWLSDLAARHRIHVGASYLEVDGDDFFNTFALAAPDGSIAGRVRKESLPVFEGWFFRSCQQPKLIETELGRIAVGICMDNHTRRFFERMQTYDADLLLMPHSAPCGPFGAGLMRQALTSVAPFYARAFGVPTVLANKAETRARTALPGMFGASTRFDFPGLSALCDSDGSNVARLDDRAGVIVGDVTLDRARKRVPETPRHFFFADPQKSAPHLVGAAFMTMEVLGKRAYTRNARRVQAAHRTRSVDMCERASAPTRSSTFT